MPCKLSEISQTTTRMSKYFLGISTNLNSWVLVFCLFIYSHPDKAYSFETISLKQGSTQGIPVSSKIDLTTLPLGKIFEVSHSKFTLQFFFNNRDIFGFIVRRKSNIGIIVHLCFFRSCEESPYDLNKVIAMPQDPRPKRTFFSVKFPEGLQYNFQGIEFLPIN